MAIVRIRARLRIRAGFQGSERFLRFLEFLAGRRVMRGTRKKATAKLSPERRNCLIRFCEGTMRFREAKVTTHHAPRSAFSRRVTLDRRICTSSFSFEVSEYWRIWYSSSFSSWSALTFWVKAAVTVDPGAVELGLEAASSCGNNIET